ncbi:hypothetical protein WJ39_08555 [Burkholderia diffusa]|nr:hypothetical protein WJ39_08555 [Burkholderia diffusa]
MTDCASGHSYNDFYAYLPTHGYLHAPSHAIWPAASINSILPYRQVNGRWMKPSRWLDQYQAVTQLAWAPDSPTLIRGRIMQESGWQAHPDACLFNLYTPPSVLPGDARLATPWIDHLKRLYPDHFEHLANWFAHTVQHPGIKINHALLLGGAPGIGKDTLLEPVRAAVGAHNFADISPRMMQSRFNGWLRNIIVRVSEVRDLGDVDRYAFYEHCKPLLAAPPDALRVDEKNLREYYVANACNIIFTSNYLADGLYLPADDRRHFVAWSEARATDFQEGYWRDMWTWYANGGLGHVGAWLRARDLATFDPKMPPPHTPAFWIMAQAIDAPEQSEMHDLLDLLNNPPAVTLSDLVTGAMRHNMREIEEQLVNRRLRRSIPRRMEHVGYAPVRNPNAEDGLFKVGGKRVVIYALRSLNPADQLQAAQRRISAGTLP